MSNMQEDKEKAVMGFMTEPNMFVSHRVSFSQGFDAGVLAERERIQRILDWLEIDEDKINLDWNAPKEQEQRSE